MRECEHCGVGFEPGNAKARFCSRVECRRERARLRKRESRGQVIELPPRETAGQGRVYSATLRALTEAGRVECPAGAAALLLASRLDGSTGDTGSSLAALSKQHLAALDEALRNVELVGDATDELRARRMQRLGRGSA